MENSKLLKEHLVRGYTSVFLSGFEALYLRCDRCISGLLLLKWNSVDK